jgi:hypothetical protein
MKCPIKFDFEGYPALKALKAFYYRNRPDHNCIGTYILSQYLQPFSDRRRAAAYLGILA